MKQYLGIGLACLLGMSVLTGCSKSGVNTGKLEGSFNSAQPATKSSVDAAVAAIQAGNYTDALAKLQALGAQAKLTPEQQQAIQDVIAQIQKQLTAQAEKAQKDAGNALGDLQKSMKK